MSICQIFVSQGLHIIKKIVKMKGRHVSNRSTLLLAAPVDLSTQHSDHQLALKNLLHSTGDSCQWNYPFCWNCDGLFSHNPCFRVCADVQPLALEPDDQLCHQSHQYTLPESYQDETSACLFACILVRTWRQESHPQYWVHDSLGWDEMRVCHTLGQPAKSPVTTFCWYLQQFQWAWDLRVSHNSPDSMRMTNGEQTIHILMGCLIYSTVICVWDEIWTEQYSPQVMHHFSWHNHSRMWWECNLGVMTDTGSFTSKGELLWSIFAYQWHKLKQQMTQHDLQ